MVYSIFCSMTASLSFASHASLFPASAAMMFLHTATEQIGAPSVNNFC
jgi:hypothetical protein